MSENLCLRCAGFCCWGMKLPLTLREAVLLGIAGTTLEDITPEDVRRALEFAEMRRDSVAGVVGTVEGWGLRRGERLYLMRGECGHLLSPDGSGFRGCGVIEDPDIRPRVCGEYEVGGKRCSDLREQRQELLRV